MDNQILRFNEFTGRGEEKRFAQHVLESEGIFEESSETTYLNESELLLESAEPKDIKRIEDIVKKSAGSTAKEAQLAETMAKLITKKDKAMRRYEAALQLLGKDHHITHIFGQKAIELGNKVDLGAAAQTVAPTNNTTVQAAAQPEFVYDQKEANEAWDLFLSYTAKLRGYNWGTPFTNKIAKLPAKTRVYLAIISAQLVNAKYDEKRRMSYFDEYRGGKKFTSAYDIPSREWMTKGLLGLFNYGDAKTNPANPTHILFKYENAKEEKARKLEDLRQAAATAYSNYKKPQSMFQTGEEYHIYSKGNGSKIVFNDPWALYFWNHNMIGQMSDGYWENSRKYNGEWRFWSGLSSLYDPNVKPPAENSMTDIMNPKLVQQYAIQSNNEYAMMGKVMVLNDKKFLSLIEYGSSIQHSIENIGSLENAETQAEKLRMDLNDYLAFLFAPIPSMSEIKKKISNAHTEIANAMKRVTYGEMRELAGKSN